MYLIFGTELIDTLWNVNQIVLAIYNVFMRINRYIMECKSMRKKVESVEYPGINRYIMECKF